jgi:hypothetical protein
MFEGNGEAGIDAIAGKLLECFMNKDILYAPLVECRENYEQYFKKDEGKIPPADLPRFQKQHEIIDAIIKTLDNDPNDKERLMKYFEEMQEYGQPPAGITSVTLPTQF